MALGRPETLTFSNLGGLMGMAIAFADGRLGELSERAPIVWWVAGLSALAGLGVGFCTTVVWRLLAWNFVMRTAVVIAMSGAVFVGLQRVVRAFHARRDPRAE